MGQMGMQMPGARAVRRPQLNVYTALAFIAVVVLLIACGLVWQASASLSPGSGLMAPFEIQDENSVTVGS